MQSQMWRFFREGIDSYIRDDAPTRGAAIAFYAVTAIAPILYIAVAIAGFVFGGAAAREAIAGVLAHVMSRESADLLKLAIRNAWAAPPGILNGTIGVVTLVVTASGVFGEMEDALNIIWRAPRKGAILPRLLRGRAMSLALVIAMGAFLLAFMFLATAVAALQRHTSAHLLYGASIFSLLNFAISFGLTIILFAAIYKIVPNKKLEWRDVIPGAVGTALLFEMGRFLLGYYLENVPIARPYGAAGGVIVLLVWVYCSAQVFLLGAEYTRVFAVHYGSQKIG